MLVYVLVLDKLLFMSFLNLKNCITAGDDLWPDANILCIKVKRIGKDSVSGL
jgi:hypothetical protein